jgi:hypothetical protein
MTRVLTRLELPVMPMKVCTQGLCGGRFGCRLAHRLPRQVAGERACSSRSSNCSAGCSLCNRTPHAPSRVYAGLDLSTMSHSPGRGYDYGEVDLCTERAPIMDTQGEWTSNARRLWLWLVAILVGFPIGGLVADLVDGVDSVGAALAGGLIAGAIIEAAQWSALRQWVSWLWIPATSVGMALGLAAGAALVDYGIDR